MNFKFVICDDFTELNTTNPPKHELTREISSIVSVKGLNYLNWLNMIYDLLFLIVSEKDLEPYISKLAYKEALVTEMKEFVDSFYSEMSKKISSIKKEQSRDIRKEKRKMKCQFARACKWAKLSKKFSQDISYSNLTLSSWASEKQNDSPKAEHSHRVSESRSLKQDQEWELPNTPVPNDTPRDSSSLGNASFTQTFTTSTSTVSHVRYKESTC